MTRRVLLAVGLMLSTGCATGRVYRDGELRLVANYTAKETCSCLYVLQQPEEFCRAWTHYDPPVATWTTDTKTKTVEEMPETGSAAGSTRARYQRKEPATSSTRTSGKAATPLL